MLLGFDMILHMILLFHPGGLLSHAKPMSEKSGRVSARIHLKPSGRVRKELEDQEPWHGGAPSLGPGEIGKVDWGFCGDIGHPW